MDVIIQKLYALAEANLLHALWTSGSSTLSLSTAKVNVHKA